MVKIYHSLAAKFFYLASFIVVLTVAVNSWQNSSTFRGFLDRQIQDSLMRESSQASFEISSILENWVSQTVTYVSGAKEKVFSNQFYESLLESNLEFFAFQIFVLENGKVKNPVQLVTKNNPLDQIGTNTNKASLSNKVFRQTDKWISKIGAGDSEKFQMRRVNSQTNSPLMSVLVKFSDKKRENFTYFAVLHVWGQRLEQVLPKTTTTQSLFLGKDDALFASSDPSRLITSKQIFNLEHIKSFSSQNIQQGYKGATTIESGKSVISSFSRLNFFQDYMIVVERDEDTAFLATQKVITRSILWALLFVLLSMAFCFVFSSGITKQLRELTFAANRIAGGDFDARVHPKTKDEVSVLGHSINNMAEKIVGLLKEQLEKARFEKELETARMVQDTFFPRAEYNSETLSVSGKYFPATECGGDWWGHFSTKKGQEYIIIADAMGHGVPAAMLTAMAFSTVMTIQKIIKDDENVTISPATILKKVNANIMEALNGKISMTFFVAALDMQNGEMTYANAGHNFPFILPLDSDDDRVKKSSKALAKNGGTAPISLSLMGQPCGLMTDVEYSEQKIKIRAGDKVVFFTDGLIECENTNGKMIGRKGLLEQSSILSQANGKDFMNQLFDRAFQFFADQPRKDDITVVVAEISKNWKPQTQNDSTPLQYTSAA